MRPQFLMFVFICIGGFMSCSKDNETTTKEIEPPPLLLKEIRINNLLHSTYEYNSNSTIKQSTLYFSSSGEPAYVDDYVYVGDTTIVSRIDVVTADNIYVRKYFDKSATQGRRDTYENGTFIGYKLYNFDDDSSCGSNSIWTYNTFGQQGTTVAFDVTDENCSSITTVTTSINNSFIQYEYTRSEKYSAINSILIPFLRISKVNAITTYVRNDENGEMLQSSTYTAEMEFNEMDHPIRETRNYRNGNVRVYTYTYF